MSLSPERPAGLALAAAAALLSARPSRAGEIHSYTDARGVVHLYNTRRPHARKSGSLQLPMPLLEAVIEESAAFYKIPRALVKAVIAAESNYNPWAVSARGAIGLMQLMPQTARDMYVQDPYDPVQNIQGGTRYLRVLVNRYDGDLIKVLAAYNAGPDQVDRSSASGGLGVPPIAETQSYVKRVIANYHAFEGQGAG